MADEVRISPALLRAAATAIEAAPTPLVAGAAEAVTAATASSTENLGFQTSQAVVSFAEDAQKTAQRVIRAFQSHAQGLRANADNYERTEEDNRVSFT